MKRVFNAVIDHLCKETDYDYDFLVDRYNECMDKSVSVIDFVDKCTAYEPVGTLTEVHSKLCPTLSGHILRWIDNNQFIASITNRDGIRGEMICHTDYWEVRTV